MEKSQFLLRLPIERKKALEEYAKAHEVSVNQAVNDIIAETLSPTKASSLEQRHFIGSIIEGKQIDKQNGLVLVKGIYYRYLVEGNQPVNNHGQYVVLEASGNILTLRPLVGSVN